MEDCVRSMAACDHPDTEIIVVDDRSEDGTGEALRRLAAELGITVLHLPENVGKKHALVRACEIARGDVLVFTDSDCVIAPDAVGRCVRALVRHPELGAVSGHCRALNADASLLARMQDVWYEGQFRIAKAAEASFGSVSCVSGPLAAFRRDAVFNYLPAWANDTFLGAPFRFATDRQLTGYVLGQAWQGRALKDAHRASPFVTARDYPEREWRVGTSVRRWCGPTSPRGCGPSCGSRSGGRRASSGTCSSPVPSCGAGAPARPRSTTGTSCGWSRRPSWSPGTCCGRRCADSARSPSCTCAVSSLRAARGAWRTRWTTPATPAGATAR
ncbi:glycosyltransferase family 2 protein [Streptomyces sp. M19]